MENSFSPISLARPPVAAMLPAVSEASEVVSRFSVAPTEAMSWPFLSTRKTIFALASRARRSQTALICWNSSSYITICGCIREDLFLSWGSLARDANRASYFGPGIAPRADPPTFRDVAALDRSRWHSNFTPPLQGAGEGDLVGVLEVAAHGNALRDAGDAHAERLHQPGDVERRRFAFDGRVGGDDHFLDAVVEARDQLLQLELIGSDAVERRERAVQHVVAAAELPGALDGEQIGHRLDYADHPPVALGVAAEGTRILGRQVATGRAETDLLPQRKQRLGELAGVLGWALQDVERQPLGRLLPDPGQLREQHGEAGDRIGHFGKPGSIPPSPESGFSAAAASCAALSAEFTAAVTRSSSMATSRGSTACLSICTFWISPLPLAVTITMPPPLEPVTIFWARRSCASRICSWSCCACWKSAFKSNPGMPYSSPRSRTSSISPPRTSTAARTAGCSRASAIRLSDAAARSFCFCSATEVSAGASCSAICSGTRKPSAFSNAASTAGRASCTIAACPAPLRKAICTPPRSIFKGMACSSAAAAPDLRAARTDSNKERPRPFMAGP